MKNYCAKIVVKLKPTIKDIKGFTLKEAVENLMNVRDLECKVGSYYNLCFYAEDNDNAKEIIDKIAQEILSNDVIEMYEILSLEEING